MRIKQYALVVAACVTLLGGTPLQAASPIQVQIFSGFQTTGGGAPYSSPVGAFSSADIMFGTDTGFLWHPFGLVGFGADLTGFLNVPVAGTYNFTLTSDDGALLFIDGTLIIDDGGEHVATTLSNSVALAAGAHAFEIQFFSNRFDPSGLDLILPPGVSYLTIPPSSLPAASMWGLLGLAGVLACVGLRRLKPA